MLPCNVQLSAIERDFMGGGGGGSRPPVALSSFGPFRLGVCYTSISRLEESLHVDAKIVRLACGALMKISHSRSSWG